MPNKSQMVWLGIGIVVGVVAANKLRSLPLVKSLPTL